MSITDEQAKNELNEAQDFIVTKLMAMMRTTEKLGDPIAIELALRVAFSEGASFASLKFQSILGM